MNLDFDLEGQLAALTGNRAENPADNRLDWCGLRARLAAGHAARAVLECTLRVEPPVDGGSFDSGSARTLALYGAVQGARQGPVNPTALANCNSGCDKDADVASASVAGD